MFTKNPRLRGATTIAAYVYRITSLIAILCALPGIVSAAVSSPDIFPRQPVNLFELSTALDSPAMAVGIKAGEALFTGQRRFQNGGPPCATCHSVATLPFPSGGTMAPDLTHEYSKLGPEGMHYALRTLYFPRPAAAHPPCRRPACRPWVPRNEGTECSTQTDPPYKHLAITPAIPEARTQGIGC